MSINHAPKSKGSQGLHRQPGVNMQNARTVEEILAAIDVLQRRQTALTTQLEASLASNEQNTRQLTRLNLSRARVGSVAVAARSLSRNMLGEASVTAGRISQAVEELDIEQDRVKATLSVVEQVVELKACVLGVVGCMGATQDWETAAEYISRASKIPADVVNSGFAATIVPTAEVPDPPGVTLNSAAQSLSQLFLREFEAAVEREDGASITRFFKMFPLIGRSKQGLDAYGKYVCQGVASRARANMQAASASARQDGLVYSKALTKLFEHIAQVIDSHTPLVERHYGAGTMVKVVERLHREADVQGGIILDTWNDERTIDRKLTDVKSYAFSFLVQSFLPAQKPGTRTQSPAPKSDGKLPLPADEGVDLRDIDQTLNEISAMLMPWSLYLRFISSRTGGHNNSVDELERASILATPDFLRDGNLPRKISQILLEPFNTFASFYLRRSVERAFQLEETPQGLSLDVSRAMTVNPPYITSSVDDVMYIVNQVLQRSLATSQASLVIGLISTISRVLGSDFIGMIQRKMKDETYPKPAIQGAMPPEDKITQFVVLINNLDVSIDYMRRIVHSHIMDGENGNRDNRMPLDPLFPMNNDADKVRKALLRLEAVFQGKASDLRSDALTVLFNQVVKQRIRPILAEAFRDAEYSDAGDSISADRTSEEFTREDPESSSISNRVKAGWEALIGPLRRLLTDHNCDKLLDTTTTYISNLLEKRILSYRGRMTQLGAVQLERHVIEIVNVVVKGQDYRSRETFSRCLQIMTIVNMEQEEWQGMLSSETTNDDLWVLDSEERLRARSLIDMRD